MTASTTPLKLELINALNPLREIPRIKAVLRELNKKSTIIPKDDHDTVFHFILQLIDQIPLLTTTHYAPKTDPLLYLAFTCETQIHPFAEQRGLSRKF